MVFWEGGPEGEPSVIMIGRHSGHGHSHWHKRGSSWNLNSLFVTVCVLPQYLLQSCSRGGKQWRTCVCLVLQDLVQ
jgi:hypothetical protein